MVTYIGRIDRHITYYWWCAYIKLELEECTIITEEATDYMDYLNPCNKNQTAKILERFFYVSNGREYISVIPDEAERITKLPTLDEVKEDTNRVVTYAKEIILNADKYKDMDIEESVLKQYACDIDPLLDKIIAINIADILSQNKKPQNKEQLKNVWVKSLEELKTDWDRELEAIPSVQNTSYEVDTTNLQVGMVVKNYKELCELLHEKPLKSGNNSHKAQQKRWARYFSMEKGRGRSIVILDIYDEPLPADDKRKAGNRNIYLKYIETILLKYMYYKKGQVCYATRNQLWSILGMINSNYKKIPLHALQVEVEYSNVTKWQLNNFYMRCNSRLNSILFTALNNLSNRSLIDYQIQTMIVVPSTDKKNTLSRHYVADDDEIGRILAVERKVLNNMGLESKNHAACTMRLNEFYNKVNEILFDMYGWERKYERIKIIFNEADIQEAITKNEYELQMLYLNELVIGSIDKNAQTVSDNRMKKALIEYDEYVENWKEDNWGKVPALKDVEEIFTYPKYYVDIQRKLSQKFLSIKYEKEQEEKRKQYDKELDDIFANLGVE